MGEVLQSQETMLRRLNRPAAPKDQMKGSFAIHLGRLHEWLVRQHHMRVLKVSYNRLLTDPKSEARKVWEFLDGRPAPDQMLAAIDTSLYRNRKRPDGLIGTEQAN